MKAISRFTIPHGYAEVLNSDINLNLKCHRCKRIIRKYHEGKNIPYYVLGNPGVEITKGVFLCEKCGKILFDFLKKFWRRQNDAENV